MHVVHIARDEHGAILEISEPVRPADRVIVIDDYDIEQEPTKPEVPSEI